MTERISRDFIHLIQALRDVANVYEFANRSDKDTANPLVDRFEMCMNALYDMKANWREVAVFENSIHPVGGLTRKHDDQPWLWDNDTISRGDESRMVTVIVDYLEFNFNPCRMTTAVLSDDVRDSPFAIFLNQSSRQVSIALDESRFLRDIRSLLTYLPEDILL